MNSYSHTYFLNMGKKHIRWERNIQKVIQNSIYEFYDF